MRKIFFICAGFLLALSTAQAERIEYEYDAHGRLVKVQRCDAGNPCTGNVVEVETEYSYDDADNRTEKDVTVHPPS